MCVILGVGVFVFFGYDLLKYFDVFFLGKFLYFMEGFKVIWNLLRRFL